MKFTTTALPNGDIAFTLVLTPEDMKREYSYVTQMMVRHGHETERVSGKLLGLEAMVDEIEDEAGVPHTDT